MDEVWIVLEYGWFAVGHGASGVTVPDIVAVCDSMESAKEYVATHEGDLVIEQHEVVRY